MKPAWKTDDQYNYWFFLGCKFVFLGIASQIASRLVNSAAWEYHGAYCIIGVILAFGAFLRFRKAGVRVFLWEYRLFALLIFSLYFLVGAAQVCFDEDATIARILNEWSIDAKDALHIDSINAIGFGITLAVSGYYRPMLLPQVIEKTAEFLGRTKFSSAIYFFLVIGGVSQARVWLNDFSANPEVISTLWRNASTAINAAILISAVYTGRNARFVHLLSVLIAIFLSMMGLISLNKTAFIIPILALLIGVGIRRNSLVFCLFALIVSYVLVGLVGGMVAVARVNGHAGMELRDRWELLIQGGKTAQQAEAYDKYSAWSRVNYLPAQSKAIDFYDQGIGGTDFGLVPWVFVPRALYPQKPIITSTGTDFYIKITGHEGSSTGMGIFANGYYNLGWLGVFICSFVFAFIMAQCCAISRRIVENKLLFLYPLMLFAANLASNLTGILVELVGGFVILTCYIFLVRIFELVVLRRD